MARTTVTTVLEGIEVAGSSSATTPFASRFDAWKKRGKTSLPAPPSSAFESSTTVVRQRRPSLRGSRTSACSWMSRAAVIR